MNRTSKISTMVVLAAILLGAGTAANAQNLLQFNQTSFTFNAPVGSTSSQQQPLFILTSGAALSYTTSIQQTGTWLSLSPGLGTAPIAATITVNPTGLAQGTYTGTITVTSSGASNSPQNITVILTVGSGTSTSPLSATPSPMNFSYTAGGAIPPAQTLSVTSTSTQSFTVSVATSAGGNWLSANPVTATTPTTISVAVNPTGLTQGTYNGTITLTPTGFLGSPLQVPVILSVSSTPELKHSSLQPFNHQIGTPPPGSQTLSLTSTGGTLTFSAIALSQQGNWLVLSSSGGATPADLTVSVNSAGLVSLPSGVYTGSIIISAPGASNPNTTITVTLNVGTAPFVNVTPASLSFSVQPGGALPATQNLSISSTTLSYPYTVSFAGTSWLTATPVSGTTPGTVAVGVNSSALSLLPGTYTGSLTITATGSANPTLTVPVTLTVSNTPALIVNQNSLAFNYQTGRASPPTQVVSVTSSGIPAQFSVAVATAKGGQWLQVTPTVATTPWVLTVSANPAGLAPDTYTATITLTPAESGAVAVTINVTLVVSNNALLNVSPGALTFNVPQGTANVAPQNIALTSTGDQVNFNAVFTTTSGGSGWLAALPLSGTTPANLTVFVLPGVLQVGTYTGTITVSVPGANTQTIPVTLTITTGATLSASPGQITFTQIQGGTAPAAQNIALTASGTTPVSFAATATTSSCGNWLTVEPVNGSTPAQLKVTPIAVNLVSGTPCFGQITVQAPGATNSPLTIPVTLTIAQPQTLVANPASLNFSYQTGGSVPGASTIQLTSSPSAVNFTLTSATQSGGDWLTATTSGSTTPATITVSVRPQSITLSGTYNGTVTLSSPSASNSPLTVNVTLNVTAVPLPRVTTVRNAASYVAGQVAPGEIVYIEGTNLGPTALTTLKLNAQGFVDTTLAETRVLFDGIPAPLIYVWQDRMSCVVPYGVAGRVSSRMQVEYKGQLSTSIELTVIDSAPGIFTMNQQGTGQGAILNSDYSVNGPASATTRPARPGAVVMIYMTGEGQTRPTGIDGKVNSSTPYPLPLLPVTVSIGGLDAEVTYAGAAPNFVSGAMQLNVRIPPTIGSGNSIPIQVRIGNRLSQGGVTLAVQ